LQGDIREGNSYYEDIHQCAGQFDFVMANPPFNVNNIQKERIADDKARFPFGMPNNDNGNYLWIQLFYSSLNDTGRAGFVMANSAADARGSEMEIRRQLIESGGVDVIVAISSNFFYTVTLPCTLWFLDKGKPQSRKDKVLFIDARHIYKQVTRSVRDYSSEQLNFIADIVRLYRGEAPDPTYKTHHEDERNDGEYTVEKCFTDGMYQDIAGLCKVATIDEIAAQGYSLNPGRYVGVTAGVEEDEEEFAIRLEVLQEEFEVLNAEAHELERCIAENVVGILGSI
jgi:type I restriction enzyme M protein